MSQNGDLQLMLSMHRQHSDLQSIYDVVYTQTGHSQILMNVNSTDQHSCLNAAFGGMSLC